MREAWVYIDESNAPNPSSRSPAEPFWLGALVTGSPVSRAVIDDAIANLAEDPDAKDNASDLRTLQRRYFHASFDSKNAHSALCRQIVAHAFDAEFSATLWKFDRRRGDSYAGGRLHRLLTLLGTGRVFDDLYDAIHLVIARRPGSFDDRQIADWPAYCQRTRLEGVVFWPSGAPLPCRFPHVTARAAGPEEPGLQVCDFVLWAAQRARPEQLTFNGKRDWLDRLQLQPTHGGGEVEGALHWFSGRLGKGARLSAGYKTDAGIPRRPSELENEEGFELLNEIADDVRSAASAAASTPALGHLREILEKASSRLPLIVPDGTIQSGEALGDLLQAFLLICDTLPVYDRRDAAAWLRADEKRSVAAAFLSGRMRIWMPLESRLSG